MCADIAQNKNQQFDDFVASQQLSEHDKEDILDTKDPLIEKGIYAERHFQRATTKTLESPPGNAVSGDRIQLILKLFAPSELQAGTAQFAPRSLPALASPSYPLLVSLEIAPASLFSLPSCLGMHLSSIFQTAPQALAIPCLYR